MLNQEASGTLITEAAAPARPDLTDAEIAAASQEAADPAASRDVVHIGGRDIRVTFLTWKYENEMLRIISTYLRILLDAAIDAEALEEVIGALLVAATADLENVAVIILRHHLKNDPAFAPRPADGDTPAVTTDDLIREWLGEEAHFDQLVTLIRAQIAKNKLGDSLGKLWQPAVLGVRTLKVLGTLRSLNMPSSASSSTDSPTDTASPSTR